MQVQDDNLKFLFLNKWQGFLVFLSLVAGVSFASSGVVTWVAANWDYFSSLQKLYGIQLLFILACLTAFLAYWRYTRKTGQAKAGLGSQGALFLAAVITGALLALIGQVYQTGADPWTLFAIWGALLLPFLLAAPNAVIALLWCAVINLAWQLYMDDFLSMMSRQHYYQALAFGGFNLLLLVLAESNLMRLGDRFRLVPRFLSFFCLWPLLGFDDGGMYGNPETRVTDVLVWVVPVLVFVAGFMYYSRKRVDYFMLANLVGFLSAVVLVRSLSFFSFWRMSELSLFIIASLVLLTAGLGAAAINRLYRRNNPDRAHKSLWPVHLLMVCVVMVVSLLFVLFLAMMNVSFLGSGILLLLIAGVICFSGKDRSQEGLVSGSLALIGLGMMAASLLEIHDDFFNPEVRAVLRLHAGAIAAVSMAVYVLFRQGWVRFLSAAQAIGLMLLVLYTFMWVDDSYGAAEAAFFTLSLHSVPWLALASVVLFVGAHQYGRDGLRPLAWALAVTTLVLTVLNTLEASWEPGLGQVLGPLDMFRAVLAGLSPLKTGNWGNIVFQFLPAALVLWGTRRQEGAGRFSWLAAALVFVLCLYWGNGNGVVYGLILVLLAYQCRDRVLGGTGAIAMIGFLWMFYYQMELSLLQKAFLLLGTGLVLLTVTVACRHWLRKGQDRHALATAQAPEALHASEAPAKARGLLPLMTALGVVSVLTVANWGIWTHEAILQTGQRVVLALAPVDPRSLMQGDYMSLNFELVDHLRTAVQATQSANKDANGQKIMQGYAILSIDDKGVASLAGVSQSYPSMILADGKTVIMRYKAGPFGTVSLASHEYFFPEGQGPHFARAKYGEFRVRKDGKALLSGLLDENLNRL
ncbi:membrane protein [Advenella faeciporci]|uniref:Membrane protein n=1 Tax=Advenella faeciporci TaxID=797535 RepID=A0A918MXC7_9BURK|nr:GDYXXLXY domain-containing protein [Advenella faeciporci]GGW81021.1 membrane protein [Advenella faeciporci]